MSWLYCIDDRGGGRSKNLGVGPLLRNWLFIRVRPRFFDQVGHQTTNASVGNKYFFTK